MFSIPINLDIELTNRCNADCHFCPRDQTPHQGIMSAETFEQTLRRAIEFRDEKLTPIDRDLMISLCGLGEPLLNPRAIESVRMVREAGFRCTMSSNGSILNEKKAVGLLDAGLQEIDLNVGEMDDDYESVYGLPFERTLENVLRFAELAEGRCEVKIVLVDHRDDSEHRDRMMEFWSEHGLAEFLHFPIMNRGGALDVDQKPYPEDATTAARARAALAARSPMPVCGVPFGFMFVGYDGKHYLCCSDWRKEAAFGTVFDSSFVETIGPKLRAVRSRELVCHTCNHDPINLVANAIHAEANGDETADSVPVTVKMLRGYHDEVEAVVETLAPGTIDDPAFEPARRRQLIPVSET